MSDNQINMFDKEEYYLPDPEPVSKSPDEPVKKFILSADQKLRCKALTEKSKNIKTPPPAENE